MVTLKHRSIYVFPNRAGLGYGLAVILLWLLGTNYENNLVLAASFLLMALFVVSIIHAFSNIAGLQLQVHGIARGFVGELIDLPVELNSPSTRLRQSIELALSKNFSVRVDSLAEQPQVVTLGINAEQRGWLQPERLLVQSYYPLGMLRVWSWVYLDTRILVYPRPLVAQLAALGDEAEEDSQSHRGSSHDDFVGFQTYQAGAPLAHVAWKQYARGAGLQLKQFGGAAASTRWLDYRALAGNTEARLSGLCYLALQWHRAGHLFGLRLPGQVIVPAVGEEHLHKVLRALALFGQQEPRL